MTRISSGDLAPVGQARVDARYQDPDVHRRQGTGGAKPTFTDREVITLLRWMDFLPLPYPGESPRLEFVRAHSLPLCPRLLDPSPCHRPAGAPPGTIPCQGRAATTPFSWSG